MRYYHLHTNVLRNHLGAENVYFKVEDDMMEFETIVMGKDKKNPWASLHHSTNERFDTSDCEEITAQEYKRNYEQQNYLNSL